MLTTYHRTSNSGNITQHAANAEGTEPICGAGPGVDGYVKEWPDAPDVNRHVHCRRCLYLLERAPKPVATVTTLHIEKALLSILEDPSLKFDDPPALAIDKYIHRLLKIASEQP